MSPSLPEVDLLVVGSGPSGLGAAWRAEDRYSPPLSWALVERAATPGGLAASIVDDRGFTWDLGGHVIYSHYLEFDELLDQLLGADWVEHERAGWIRTHGRFIPYPIQRNIRHLPAAELLRCVEGMLAIHGREPPPAADFEAWLQGSFGAGLVDVFFRPFNRKMWAHEPRELACDWTRSRSGSRNANVPLVDLRAVLRTIVLGVDDPGWDSSTRFRYPAVGGTGAIWEALAGQLPTARMHYGRDVVAVDAGAHTATLADGATIRYGAMVSSMPLDLLLGMLTDQPALARRAGELDYASTQLVGLGMQGALPPELRDKYWLYFPEPDVPFHRVSVLSNYSGSNVPDQRRHWSLLCEVNDHPSARRDPARVMAGCVDAVRRTFDLPEGGVISRWQHRLDRGYPVPTLRRDGVLAATQSRLKDLAIYSRGRFGGWRYEVSNQDHAFMQGVEAVDAIMTGAPEVTYEHPEAVDEPSSELRLVP